MEFIRTTLYQKLAMESFRKSAEKRLFWVQNTVDFYSLESVVAVQQKHHFLHEKAMYFQIIGKKVIRQNGNFIVLTLAEDLCGKVFYIFMYVPRSKRRFVVKFDKDLLVGALSKYVGDLTQTMNSTPKFHMKRKIQNVEELISGLVAKKQCHQNQDLKNWVELFEDKLLWEKKENSVWLFNLGNLAGIVREYISIRVFESQQILLETYIDGYLNQIDIFKPYAPAIINDLRHFSFFVNLTKPQRIIRKNDNINIYNFLRIANFCPENQTEVNGNFFKNLVHLLEEKIFEKLSKSEISFHKINLSDFKESKSSDAKNEDEIKTNKIQSRRQFLDKHTFIGEAKYNCQIVPIFSTVFTISPRRIFSIYFNQASNLKRRNHYSFDLQHARKKVFPKRVFF